MSARGKRVTVTRHAYNGMHGERPPIGESDVEATLEDPDHDDGHQARRWIGHRTIIAYYSERPDEIRVHGVSATHRRFPP